MAMMNLTCACGKPASPSCMGQCRRCHVDAQPEVDGFVSEAEFDAVFPWELAPLSEEQPAHRENLGNCTGCGRAYVYVDARWSMCTRCWDAIPAEYDAWVATLPRAIPLDSGSGQAVAPASWPVWVLAATALVLISEIVWLLR
jgi:hypothetical protein